MITIGQLFFRYPPLVSKDEGLLLLDGLSLQVAPGERVALMGATGAGKSTLALILAGLVPTTTGGTLEGRIQVAGQDVRVTSAADLSAQVGVVFQQSDHQLFNMSVEDEVAFGLEGLGLPADEIERRIMWVLQRVGLQGLEERAPWQLSGGQQKRLAIASVLVMRPTVLLLDEPMAGLDPLGRRAIAELLDELKTEYDTTILTIEQDVEWVARWADRILVLHKGRIVLDGSTRSILSQVATLKRYAVPSPQIAQVAAALQLPKHPLTSTNAAPLIEAMMEKFGSQRNNTPLNPLSRGEFLLDSPLERGLRGVLSFPSGQDPDNSLLKHANPPAIEAKKLVFAYANGPNALNQLSLTIPTGQFVALAGPNGGGKSTFAKHLNGLLRPNQGSVSLFGQATVGRRVGELAQQVGYLFQNPDLQIFAVTVREEIAFGPRNLGLSEPEVRERVEAALARFELEAWADAPPAILGYGLRRLVTLASVWAMQPPIWVLDEPTTGLDAHFTRLITAEMQALHRAGHTILLISHDLRLVAALAERLVIISEGQVALDGSTRELLTDASALRPFELRPPPVTRLASKLSYIASDVLTVEELVAKVGELAGFS